MPFVRVFVRAKDASKGKKKEQAAAIKIHVHYIAEKKRDEHRKRDVKSGKCGANSHYGKCA
jgi:hypothetical protein